MVVASDPEWSPLARYALAWLDGIESREPAARNAHERLAVDHAGTGVATRATVRLALALHREGKPGRAAWWLQSVAGRPEAEALAVAELREAAVRDVLRETHAAAGWSAASARPLSVELRGAAAVARGAGTDP